MSTDPVKIAEPKRFTQGEDVDWTRGFEDYPATEWTLEYRFRGPGTGFNVPGTANGEDFVMSVSSTDTAAMSTGEYLWQAWATNISNNTITRKIADGSVVVDRGFTTGSTGTVEIRTPAKIMLDTIDAALLASAGSDVLSYEITTPAGTRKISKQTRTEAIEQRKYWAAKVSRENTQRSVREGKPFGKSVGIRMGES